jgi:hypothetical protein
MEPNNFEKDFREKLNQRTIEPSDKAWDRLDAMLSIAEEKQSKRKNKWLYIAASVVGFLLVGTFFFNQQKSVLEGSKKEVVIEETVKKDSVMKPITNDRSPIQEQIVMSEKEVPHQGDKPQKKQQQNYNQSLINKSNQVTESSIIKKINQEKQASNNQTEIAQMSKNENVDQLLESAEKSVVAENSFKPKSKIKINANDLLNQVDGELELSFRERVITKVNKNFQTVKVALANRNQQE